MTTPLNKQKCENCRYFELEEAECHRHAPQPSYEGDRSAFWPMVANDDWCGEWAQR